MWKYVSSDLIANKKPNVLDRYWIINIVAKIIFDIVASLTPSPPLVWRFCSGWMNPPPPPPPAWTNRKGTIGRKKEVLEFLVHTNSVANPERRQGVMRPLPGFIKISHGKDVGHISFMFLPPPPTPFCLATGSATGTGRSVATGAPIVAWHALWHVSLRYTTIKVYIIWHITVTNIDHTRRMWWTFHTSVKNTQTTECELTDSTILQ